MRNARKKSIAAFTLVELIVVIIIIAILAAVAVPRFYDRADDARRAATLQSLSTLRSAIELYRADTGAYASTLSTDILPYIKGPFPRTSIGGTENAAVITVTGDTAIALSDLDDTGGWVYNSTTGEIRINLNAFFDQ